VPIATLGPTFVKISWLKLLFLASPSTFCMLENIFWRF
jgi:hypothetical protein